MKLNRIKIYAEDPTKEATAENLVVELNGQKLDGLVGITFSVQNGNIPVAQITLATTAEIEADAETTTDSVSF